MRKKKINKNNDFTLFVKRVKRIICKCQFVQNKKFKEKHYEIQLFQFLSSYFGYRKVFYQKKSKEGIVDLHVADGNFHVEIEIKMHRGSSSLDRLVGQVLKYRKAYYRKKNRYLLTLIITRKSPDDLEKTNAYKEISKLRNVEVLMRKIN